MTHTSVAHDIDVIDLLSGANTLRDAVLLDVAISASNGIPIVNSRFKARSGSSFSQVEIHFTGIVAFDFRHREDYIFLDVWDLKFPKLEDDTFYIALDPDPETLPAAGVAHITASETDQFFIRARHVEASVT